ncbi:MAG: hypothetical protein A4E30_01084 [Methanomassiliicoccales archaeon PtaB.Bin215]|nr:MAG: hypothetical protein A4E30_01084 [Methanomassiliicoccales archaeon PtaB.Bin215]
MSASSPPTIWPRAPTTAEMSSTMPTTVIDMPSSLCRYIDRKGITTEKPREEMMRP